MQDQPDHEDLFLFAIEERTRKNASNLIITRRWSSELHEDSAVLRVLRVAEAKCKQNSSLERNNASI
jgi:hypothetical protein